jgi:hypothetical protein
LSIQTNRANASTNPATPIQNTARCGLCCWVYLRQTKKAGKTDATSCYSPDHTSVSKSYKHAEEKTQQSAFSNSTTTTTYETRRAGKKTEAVNRDPPPRACVRGPIGDRHHMRRRGRTTRAWSAKAQTRPRGQTAAAEVGVNERGACLEKKNEKTGRAENHAARAQPIMQNAQAARRVHLLQRGAVRCGAGACSLGPPVFPRN